MEFSRRPLEFSVIRWKWIEMKNEMNRKSKNTVEICWDFVRIFTSDFKCVCVCVCVKVCVCVCAYLRVFVWVVVAYYCVCMCEWYIVHVYMKVHARRVFFTDVSRLYILCCNIIVWTDSLSISVCVGDYH